MNQQPHKSKHHFHLQTSTLNGDPLIQPETFELWKQQILSGITQIPKFGVPGRSIVFGINATPILLGDTPADVFISAAQLGKGRVILITHDAYQKNFLGTHQDPNVAQLHQNIKKWVTQNEQFPTNNFMKSEDFVKSNMQLEISGLYSIDDLEKSYTDQERQKVLNFVKNGGGLIVARCPWGWAQLGGTSDFNKMLNYRTLLQAGLVLTDKYIECGDNFDCEKEIENHSHFNDLLNTIISPKQEGVDYSKLKFMVSLAKYLPERQKKRIYSLVLSKIPYSEIQQNAPTSNNKITDDYIKCRLTLYQQIVLQSGQPNVVAPGHDQFPGKINTDYSEVKYHHEVPFQFVPQNQEEYHHTGFYAVAGQTVTIKVIGDLPKSPWQVFIGFHFDNNTEKTTWIRWPRVSISADVNSNLIELTSPFGGLIIFKNHSKSKNSFKVTLSNVVEAPFYDSQNQQSVTDWNRRKQSPGVWGCVLGKYTGICFPSYSFKNLDDPLKLLNLYDEIVEAYHTLRGTDPSKSQRQYAVSDIDPVVGYMHSGFPLVTMLDVADPKRDCFLFNEEQIKKKGNWGYFHEMGHNMQRDFWTYNGSVEVTCNIFSLKAIQIATGIRPKNAPWFVNEKKHLKKYLQNPDFTRWKNHAGIGLAIYVQVIEDFGWQTLQRVFTAYEQGKFKSQIKTDQQKIDMFWKLYSIEAGEDLAPLLTKWGIPFTNQFSDVTNTLPQYAEKVNIFE